MFTAGCTGWWGGGNIGRFLEDLARPHVVKVEGLEAKAGFGCTGYKGVAPTDAQLRIGVREGVKRRWEKRTGTGS